MLGSKTSVDLSYLWKFNQATFSWKQVQTKGSGKDLRMCGMCCCMVGDRIILYGGCNGEDTLDGDLHVLDLNPSLEMLCKLAVVRDGLEQSELPHNIRWELVSMTTHIEEDIEETDTEIDCSLQ